MLEQLDLSSILQRVEMHAKTGLLVVDKGEHRVELYFRDGRLMALGPMHSPLSLGEQLCQMGYISTSALQQVLALIGNKHFSEISLASKLIELGYVNQDQLRSWATRRAQEAIRTITGWSSGTVSFEEQKMPPADRLLVAVAISSFLSSQPSSIPVTPQSSLLSSSSAAVSQLMYEQVRQAASVGPTIPETPTMVPADVSNIPTLLEAAQFIESSSLLSASALLGFADEGSPSPMKTRSTNEMQSLSLSSGSVPVLPRLQQSQPMPVLAAPQQVDISYMQPDMVLASADMTQLVESNAQIQITPDQWRVLTRVDGHTSLKRASQELLMAPSQLCVVAGGLVALGIIRVVMPEHQPIKEFSPVSKEYAMAGLNNGYVMPGAAVAPTPPWAAALPSSDVMPQQMSPSTFETRSQWGNGGNGATFVAGYGWAVRSNSPQSFSAERPVASVMPSPVSYMPSSGRR